MMAMKSDAQIRLELMAALENGLSVDRKDLAVEVDDGFVTLVGYVGSYAEKLNAERSVHLVSGVKAVAVKIEVRLVGSSRRDDDEIARSSENVLQWAMYVIDRPIKVQVDNGWITLSGEVDRDDQRQAVEDAVQFLMGITGVSNHIGIKAGATEGFGGKLVAVNRALDLARDSVRAQAIRPLESPSG